MSTLASPIPPVGPGPEAAGGAARAEQAGAAKADDTGFAEALRDGVAEVSAAEGEVDAVAQELAVGGDAEVHDLMAATAKASLSVDLLVQARNRAVEAYQEIMRMQV